jgi:predicted nucleotidyltransferase
MLLQKRPVMDINQIEKMLKEHKLELKKRYGVKSIAIFGSFARGEQTISSDVDLLIELETPIGFKFIELADYLESILGMRVDLLTKKAAKQKARLWKSIKEDLIYV